MTKFLATGETGEAAKKTEGQKAKGGAKKEKKEEGVPAAVEVDISKLDIRVGTITKAWEHEEADRLYCEEIDVGEGTPRLICSGLREHYSLSELEGKKVLVLANLKTRKMVGVPSHGMVLCAFTDDDGTVKFVDPPEGAPNGARVVTEGYDGEPATEVSFVS